MSYETPVLTAGNPSNQTIWESVTTPRHDVGTRGQMIDGRSFYYACSRGSSAIPCGNLLSNSPVDVDCDDLAIATLAVGTTSAAITFAGTKTYALNELTGGFMQVNSGSAGNDGRQYRILSNPATTAATEFTLVFEAIREEAFVAASTVTILANPYSAVTISAAITSMCVGATVTDIAAGDTNAQYFWAQTWGPACVLSGVNGDILGHALKLHTTDGATLGFVDAAADVAQIIGTNLFTSVGADFMPVFLQIAP